MSEATVVITETLERRSDKAPWAAKDGNGQIWKRWDQDWTPYLNKRLKLTYEDVTREGKGQYAGRTFEDKIVSESELVSGNGDEPKLGSGDYITGQKPPIEARRIFASTAANNATQLTALLLQHQTSREVTPELVRAAWDAMNEHIFQDLIRRGNAFIDELDINF